MKRALRKCSVLIAAIFLFACSATPSTPPQIAVGLFTDGPVYGLSYVSGAQSGTTDANGFFTYEVGNTVRFYVGGVTIGEAAAKSPMTPVDLAKTLAPAANASNQYVVNIVRFLMSISTIDASTGRMTIDPSKVIGSASASDFNVSTYKFTTTLAGISSGPKYTEAQAKAHFTGAMTKKEYQSGTTGNVYYYTYNANGLMTKEERDIDNNGTIDSVLYYTYDANGNNTRIDYDNDNNGTIDAVLYYTYNANGLMTKEERDIDGNGTIDSVSYYTYDANGNNTIIEYDNDNNGTIDAVIYYTYDTNGLMTKEERDIDGNGTIDSVSYYTYDANGNNTIIEYDNDNNSTIDAVIYYTYDTNSLMTKEEQDIDGNGTIDSVSYYTYDANGNNTIIEYDNDNNGTIDAVIYYTWQKI